jgi:hypothetical protein
VSREARIEQRSNKQSTFIGAKDMQGTMIADDKGWVIETLYTLWNEPAMLIQRYRVTVMNGRPESASERVQFSNCGSQCWIGRTFQAGTDNQPPESQKRIEIKKPRGKKVWRDGEWRKA